ncbi:MAG: hypothetical protein DRH21_05185 [Deltaproteobacteria bacterium]|nr:MAG: hypothetical protein DRH21_05185 [Deltaproteobacteria bacterium]
MKNNPIDHHYVPVFYLNSWISGKDKKLWYYKKIDEKVVGGRIAPKNTGYEPNLNTLKSKDFSGIKDDDKYIVEQKLVNLDTDASKVLKKMITNGVIGLSLEEKKTWLNFVLLLFERNPQRINTIENEGEQILQDVVNDCIEKWGKQDRWEHAYKFFKKSEFNYNYPRIRLYDFLKDTLSLNDQFVQNWQIVKTHDPFEFFTSNLPVIIEVSKSHSTSISFIEMSLSPQTLWICALPDFQFDEDLIKRLIITFNMRLLMLQPKYVYSLSPIKDIACFKYGKALDTFL